MIKIINSRTFGVSQDLIAMHQLRNAVFRERMGWELQTENDLEIDQFDRPDTVYILVYDDNKLVGSCRLIDCQEPYMISEIWPEYLQTIHIKQHSWELSRFAVNHRAKSLVNNIDVSDVTVKLFYAVTVFCIAYDVPQIYAMHDLRVRKIVRKIGCHPTALSKSITIDNIPCSVGEYITNESVLDNFVSYLGGVHPEIYFPKENFAHAIHKTNSKADRYVSSY